MEDINNTVNFVSYESLVAEIRQLYGRISNFKQVQAGFMTDIQELGTSLERWQFSHSFPALQQDINTLIAQWDATVPLQQLQEKLEDDVLYWTRRFDNSLKIIEESQQKLLRLPDRHNRKAVTDKVERFLQQAPSIRLASLHKAEDEIVPKLLQAINDVQKGFNADREADKQRRQHYMKIAKYVGIGLLIAAIVALIVGLVTLIVSTFPISLFVIIMIAVTAYYVQKGIKEKKRQNK